MDAARLLREQVKNEFMEYLTLHKQRKTSERFAILDHIYSTKGHFDMDSLYNSMVEVNFRVSRATLYNTIQLLLDCGLVVKHQFGANISKYERAHGNENHDHLICTMCGDVREMDGDLLTPRRLKQIRKFKVTHYSTYIYGICSKCVFAKRMKMNKLKAAEEKKMKSSNGKQDKK